jgi:hypothetical protein
MSREANMESDKCPRCGGEWAWWWCPTCRWTRQTAAYCEEVNAPESALAYWVWVILGAAAIVASWYLHSTR